MDGACLPGRTFDEPTGFQRQDHLVHGRWRDPEVLLHFGFGGRTAVDAGVVIDKGQVLALFVGIEFLHRPVCNPHSPVGVSRRFRPGRLPMGREEFLDLRDFRGRQASQDIGKIFLRV